MHVVKADQLRKKLSFSMLVDVNKGLLNRLRNSIFPRNRNLDWIIEILRRKIFNPFVIRGCEQ